MCFTSSLSFPLFVAEKIRMISDKIRAYFSDIFNRQATQAESTKLAEAGFSGVIMETRIYQR